MSKIVSLADLVASVPSAGTVAIGGFQLSRVPVALLRALAANGPRHVDAIAAPNPLALDILATAGCLRSADCGFIGFQYEYGFLIPPGLTNTLARGELELRQRDVYETIAALRGAGAQPLADVALIHAQRADRAGNLGIDDPYVDVLLAAASRRVLATVETVVERVADPRISGDRVAAVAVAERGAAPAACYGHYSHAPEALHAHVSLGSSSPPRTASDAGPVGSSEHVERVDKYIVELARQVRDGEVVVTGLASAVPMLAIELARRTHAPAARYINCVGAVNPRIGRVFSTSVIPELLDGCEATIDLPDLFDLARDGGVDAMFFGAGQVDAAGRMNLTRIGPQDAPRVRLPGPAGSPSMRSFVRRVLIGLPRQSPRNLVETVDVATSSPCGRNQETVLVTDLATWHMTAKGFAPTSLRPGVTPQQLAAHTGFAFTAGGSAPTSAPNDAERAALRDIDREGRRFGLLAPKTTTGPTIATQRTLPKKPSRSSERVFHES